MKSLLIIDNQEAESIFKNLSKDYKVIAPVEKRGMGRLSNTNLITYDEVNSFNGIEFFKRTYFSAKSVLFPIREKAFEFRAGRMNEAKEEISPTIVFLRACDINAVSRLDAHFLKNNSYEDLYYKRRRELVRFFLIECAEAFDSCFCVSMGTNKTNDYSVFLRKVDEGYEAHVKDKDFQKYFPFEERKNSEPAFIEKDSNPISILDEIDSSVFKNKLWEEYSERCIGCGRCNTSCPTCTCYTIQDIPSDGQKDIWERTRIWSSCQVKNFGLLAGNHDFRIALGDRMRYKVLHKIRDFRKRTGFNMCVGCGRCDDVCPEYISMFKCIEKLNQISGAGKKDG